MIYRAITKDERRNVIAALRHYALELDNIHILRNKIANNNQIYLIRGNNKSKYILRISTPSKSKNHLELEISILNYLQKHHFELTPKIIPNIKNSQITVINKKYYILQSFIPGEVKSGVSNLTHFSDDKLINFFKASAKFSLAIQDFPVSKGHENITLFHYINNGKSLIKTKIAKIKNKNILQLVKNRFTALNDFLDSCKEQMLQLKYDKLPKQIVHFDLHPGNVNYTKNEVTGIFDFDWARFDTRITDLACTIGQSCYRYRGKNRSKYDQHKILSGLKAYYNAYGKSEFTKTIEKQLITAGLKAYMFYQLLWILNWHLANPKDNNGYKYIEFSLNVIKLNNFDTLIPNYQS